MLTKEQWDLIGYGVWAIIIYMTLKQFLETRRPVKGNGLRILLSDILLVAPLPWIIEVWYKRGVQEDILLCFLYGVLLAIPYILFSNYAVNKDGKIQFKSNIIFYIILFAFPILRYEVRTYIFNHHPIFFQQYLPKAYVPDIEIMLSYYIMVLVVSTFVWRLWCYFRFRAVAAKAQANRSMNA
ncbi:CcdC protein domain-containing protein [Tumebacillus flagellatus]|uniref:Uncharacterized protein n=1 Tax=Tumebacillus flagellatus TaxID=1157490 RepID=A0A074LN38_9BACL|nr:CcdC protein domain-containing protein [Tumebacillus flagellatus]KEO81258.1 hypothetical protein EL26_21900 [Tumebacillus flagellatus]